MGLGFGDVAELPGIDLKAPAARSCTEGVGPADINSSGPTEFWVVFGSMRLVSADAGRRDHDAGRWPGKRELIPCATVALPAGAPVRASAGRDGAAGAVGV